MEKIELHIKTCKLTCFEYKESLLNKKKLFSKVFNFRVAFFDVILQKLLWGKKIMKKDVNLNVLRDTKIV